MREFSSPWCTKSMCCLCCFDIFLVCSNSPSFPFITIPCADLKCKISVEEKLEEVYKLCTNSERIRVHVMIVYFCVTHCACVPCWEAGTVDVTGAPFYQPCSLCHTVVICACMCVLLCVCVGERESLCVLLSYCKKLLPFKYCL